MRVFVGGGGFLALIVLGGAAAVGESAIEMIRHPVAPAWLALLGLTLASGWSTLRMRHAPIQLLRVGHLHDGRDVALRRRCRDAARVNRRDGDVAACGSGPHERNGRPRGVQRGGHRARHVDRRLHLLRVERHRPARAAAGDRSRDRRPARALLGAVFSPEHRVRRSRGRPGTRGPRGPCLAVAPVRAVADVCGGSVDRGRPRPADRRESPRHPDAHHRAAVAARATCNLQGGARSPVGAHGAVRPAHALRRGAAQYRRTPC